MSFPGGTALVVGLSLLGLPVATTAQDWDAVEIRTVPLGSGIYVLFGQGGNLGLSVGEDGAFLVDDQFAPLTDKIIAAVRTVTPEAIRFVLNTHWHGDHTGGNEHLGQRGALIVAHENVRRRMNPQEFRDLIGRSQQAPLVALPVITFSEGANYYWNGENHFIDMKSGGNVNGIIAAADQVLELANAETRIIPGHGEVAGQTELRAYRMMVAAVPDRVRALIARGHTEDEVVAAGVTASFDAEWGANAERFVRAVYQSLARR